MASQTKNAPVKKFRNGGVTVSVWKNTHEGKDYYNATFEKSYKDKNDQWQSSTSYSATDMATLAMLSQEAFAFMTSQDKE